MHIGFGERIYAQSGAFPASSPEIEIDTKWGEQRASLLEGVDSEVDWEYAGWLKFLIF